MNTLLIIIIGFIIFSIYNKKYICKNNLLFMIVFIVLSYCVIFKKNMFESFKNKIECENNRAYQ